MPDYDCINDVGASWEAALEKIERYIQKMQQRFEQKESAAQDALSGEELRALADKALRCIPQRVEHFAKIVGVSYGKITIRSQKTRWASCSSRGNLNFNCLLMLTPEDVIDYVVVHELCHRKEMNHSKAFWNEVEKVIPDYKDKVRWLKDNGGALIRRMY